MIGGPINVSLMVGPLVPLPAPRFVVDNLTAITVNATAEPGQDSGFELEFTVDKRSLLPTVFLVVGGAVPPILRVVISVSTGGAPEVLIDGVVTHTQTRPGANGAPTTFVVKGVDLTAVMGLIDFTGFPFPAMPIEARVLVILAKYAFLGLIPVVVPTLVPEVPNPLQRTPTQQGTDLAYLRFLAARTGYVFTVIPGPAPGTSFAYFGPHAKIGLPQPALNVDMDAHTNVEGLQFSFDAEKRTTPVVFLQNQETRVIFPVSLPDITPLNPPLGLIAPPAKRKRYVRESAKLSMPAAILLGLAKASLSADVVTGTGSLDVLRYGRVLKPRTLVGVRGAGRAFDGLYFVQGVQHRLRRGEFKQAFTLVRNGLISTLPVVPT